MPRTLELCGHRALCERVPGHEGAHEAWLGDRWRCWWDAERWDRVAPRTASKRGPRAMADR